MTRAGRYRATGRVGRIDEMDVIFRTNQLERCYAESARAVRQWGPDVAERYNIAVTFLKSARNMQDAYNISSLHLHPLRGSRTGQLSIRLAGRWRLIITRGDTERSVIVEEVSNHYDD